jgi:hypothetical protein
MALSKQGLHLQLDQGINTKFDDKDLPVGDFDLVENVSFEKNGEFNKRFGYDEIKGEQIGGTQVQTPIGVTKYKEQLLWVSRDQIYSYSEGARVFQNEGSFDAIVPKSNIVVQNGKEQSELQCAYLQNYKVFVYMEGSVHKISVVDDETGSYVLYNQTVDGSTRTGGLRLVVKDNKLQIFGTDGSNVLKYQVFDLLGFLRDGLAFESSAAGALGGETTVATLHSSQKYDVAVSPIMMIIAYYDNSASELKFAKEPVNSETLTVGIDPFTVSVTPANAIDLTIDLYGKFVLVTANASGVVKLAIIGADVTQVKAPTTIEDVTSANFDSAVNVTSQTIDGFTYDVFYQVYESTPLVYSISTGTSTASTTAGLDFTWSNHHIRKNTYSYSTGTAGTASTIMRGVGLATKAFIQDQNVYINTIRESQLYATYYVAKSDGSIQSKISQNTGGSLLNSIRKRAGSSTVFSNYSGTNTDAIYTVPSLSNVPDISSEKFLTVSKIQGVIESGTEGTTNYYSLYGVKSSILDFNNEIVNQTEELAENLHFSGGQLKAYDGNALVEQNFNYPPEVLTLGAFGTATGGTDAFQRPGTGSDFYYYRAHYLWTDAQGNIHRSGLSDQLIFEYASTSTATSISSAEIIIPSLPLTQKENVYVEVYRTVKNGTLFYKLNANNSATTSQTFEPIANQPTADFISFIDKTPDSVLDSNETIYTTGGVLENTSPPSCSIISSFKNRLFLAGLENKLELRFSKLLSSKVGIEMNDTLSILVSQVGGDITALKAMDDKLVIFKENAIFYLAGDGPNNLGEQDTFIEPQLISSDVGCAVKNSVVLTPFGIFFKTGKGIYLLTRSLSLDYVGADVEDYNNLTITKGDIYPKDNEVRFLTSEGQALVYNYYRKFWVLYGNHRGDSSVVIGTDYYYVHKDGNGNRVFKQNPEKYDDAGDPVELVLETGWINPFMKQGAMRVYKMLILGNYYSPHQLKVSVCYDYKDYYSQTKVIDVTDYTEVYSYGEPDQEIKSTGVVKGYYGDPGGTTGTYTTAIAYGGKNVMQYQVRVDFDQQKCEAFKIKIESKQEAGQLGRALGLSDLTFIVGTKGTEYKIKQGRIFGTN